MNARVTISSRCSLQQTKLALLLDKGGAMTAYVIVQLKMIAIRRGSSVCSKNSAGGSGAQGVVLLAKGCAP